MTIILVTGGSGQVGSELLPVLAREGTVIAPGRNRMDLTSPDSIRAAIRDSRPDIIVNAAGYTTVDKAESERDLAMSVNGAAPGIIAEEAKRAGAVLVHYSTDFVYDGELDRPYVETDATNPVNVYGRTKLAGERAIEAVGGAYLILRTSWVYGDRRENFVLTILRLARERRELAVVSDQEGSPSWSRALAESTAELLRRRELIPANSGIYHLSAAGRTSRCELATTAIGIMRETCGTAEGWARVKPITSAEYPLPARRPRRPVTNKDKVRRVFGLEIQPWETQLRKYLAHRAGAVSHGTA